MHTKLPHIRELRQQLMPAKHTLVEVTDDEHYEGQVDDSAVTMMRERTGESPNGNPFNGRWVLRVDGEYIDHDQYRSDLAERYNIYLEGN